MTSLDELKQAIEAKLDELHGEVDSLELAEQNWVGGVTLNTDRIAVAVLDAIKEAGGVVLMPTMSNKVYNGKQFYELQRQTVKGYSASELVCDGYKVGRNPMIGPPKTVFSNVLEGEE